MTVPEHVEPELALAANGAGALEQLLSSVGGCAVLDGGLATELERRGAKINDPLWSAKCLLEETSADLIRQVHLDYLRAGADIIISASYQATLQGFAARGIEASEGERLLRRSVELACEARDSFWQECVANGGGRDGSASPSYDGVARAKPLVAASIGSYGAYLADGSEYSGDYGPAVTVDTLVQFHRRRIQVLANSGADLLALETIPSKQEIQAVVRVLEEDPALPIPAWISLNSKDGVHVVKGDSWAECIQVAAESSRVVAVGINCTPPRFILDLISATKKVTEKPIVIYPNSGETWDGECKAWVESSGLTDDDFVSYSPFWKEAGAAVLGGCCRTTPATIKGMAKALREKEQVKVYTPILTSEAVPICHMPHGLLGC